jgi:hypothetical protein
MYIEELDNKNISSRCERTPPDKVINLPPPRTHFQKIRKLHISIYLLCLLLNTKTIFRGLNSLKGIYHFWVFGIITMVFIIVYFINPICKLIV